MIQLSDKNFVSISRTLQSGSTTKAPTAHSDLRICYITDGTAQWCIDGHCHSVSEGDIILLNETQKRYFSAFTPSFTLQILILKRQVMENSDHLDFFYRLVREQKNIFQNPRLLSLLRELDIEYRRKLPNNWEMMSARLTEFFVAAERIFAYTPEAHTGTDANMRQLISYIDANLGQDLTLRQLADLAGMTESSLSRAFTRVNGISFRQYLMARRIEHAISLLETTEWNVIDIAYECGFSSISGFYDAFKKITGTTPRDISRII